MDKRHVVKVGLRLRLAGLPGTRSFDLGPLHLQSKKATAPQEEFMVVATLIATRSDAAEPIQIKLALKASKLGLAKAANETQKR